MSDFKKLLVWEKAHLLALHAHLAACGIRGSRNSSLQSQIIRASMSIPTNIVEGRRQISEKEFARFLRIALNSGVELEYHLILARDIRVLSATEAAFLLSETIEVRRMLHGLLRKLNLVPVHSPPAGKAPS